jgi:hypothetical protein
MLQKCMNSLRHFSGATPTRPLRRGCTLHRQIVPAWTSVRQQNGLHFDAGARPVYEYVSEHWVHAMPSAILAIALVLLAFLSLRPQLILDSTNLRLL